MTPPAMIIGYIIALLALQGAWSGRFDTPIPQRCLTFESFHSEANEAYCEEWVKAHRIYRH